MKNRDDPEEGEGVREAEPVARKRHAKKAAVAKNTLIGSEIGSEALQVSILKAIPHPVVGLRERTILFTNDAVERVFGWKTEELAGKSARIFYRTDDEYEEIGRQVYAALEKNGVFTGEVWCRCKDGRDIICRITGSPVGRRLRQRQVVVIYEDITEQKRMLEALRASEEKYRDLYENAVEGITRSTLDELLEVNPALARMHGFDSPREMVETMRDVGKKLWVDPQERERYKQILQKDGFVKGFENQVYKKDGSRIWTSLSTREVRDRKGRFLYYEGTVTDITARKQAEEALTTARLQLSSVMDLAHIVYWEVDPATNLFIFNDPFYAFYGTTAEREGGYLMTREEYGKRFIHPDDLHVLHQSEKRRTSTMEREFSYDLEHRIVRRDAQVRHIIVRVRISKDSSGRVTKYFGANQDITERKKAVELLKESEERYRVIFENSGAALAIIDEEGSVTMVNSQCENLFGCSKDEVQGALKWMEFVADPGKRKTLEANYGDRLKGLKDRLASYELPIVRKDGSIKHAVVNVTTIPGTKKTVVSFVDITDQKKVHEDLQTAYIKLQKVQAELVQAARLAVVGQLAAGVAHEIKNPLAIIVQGVEYLKSTTPGPDLDVLRMIEDASWRADKTVRDLLLFSRETVFTVRKSDIRPVIEESLALLKQKLRYAEIKVTRRYNKNLPDANIDASQVKQAFINIIMNSIEAMMPSGKGTITITADREGPGGRYVRIVIADTGIGIPDEQLGQVLDPFFTTKRKKKNVGLGLSIAQHIVERHDGRIQVQRNNKKGVRVIVDLPAA